MSTKINVIIRGQSTVEAPCVFKTVVLKSGISFKDQVLQEDTKYVVKWDYDLKGELINIPSGCIFHFDGGKLKNGSIHWNTTKIFNPYQYVILENITESGDKIIL